MRKKPASVGPMSLAERQKKLRDARLAEGRVCLKSIWLTAEAAAKLKAAVAKGESQTDVVNRLLLRSRP
jgi:hypothetical protein